MTVLGEAHLSADGGPLRWAKRLRTLGLVAVAAMLAGLLVGAGTSPAQAAPPAIIRDSPTANVTTFAEGSGVTYVAGGFTSVGAATGPGALVDSTAGVVDRRFPFVDNGSISAVAADGAGGFYLGGSFTSLNGIPRSRLAHVAADGTLDPMWKPTVAGSTPTEVYALAVSGSTVYVGGSFTQVSGTTRNRAAAVDATTGTVMAWNPNVGGSQVSALAVSESTVYLGGNFSGATAINGNVTRNRAAAVDATTGIVQAWDPNLNGAVTALAVSGPTVYLGGGFSGATAINGNVTRNRAAAVDATTGIVQAWDPNVGGTGVLAIAVSGSRVYLGGDFHGPNSVNANTTRNGAVAVDAVTGAVIPGWDPNIGELGGAALKSLAVSGATVYLGGLNMRHTNVVTRNKVAAFDSNGRVTGWNPNVNGDVSALAVMGSTVYLGGSFSGAAAINGNVTRNRAAAVDATTGVVTNWNPNLNAVVQALAVSGSTVYIGGQFFGATAINGNVTRNRAAAVDATTGIVTNWNPNVGDTFPQTVLVFAVADSTVSLGVTFASVGGESRNRAAAVDATTGAVKAWNPNLSSNVPALLVSGPTVYIGGNFSGPTAINGNVTRNRAAAVDATTGVVTAWDPNLNGGVQTMAASGSAVYLGGSFVGATAINGNVSRAYGAAVDAVTGIVTNWNPNITGGNVQFLAVSGSTLNLGGSFTSIAANTTRPGSTYFASLALSGANPSQVISPSLAGSSLTWTPPRYGGIDKYYVMYRPVGSALPWAIYAAGANNSGLSLTNPGTRNTCSSANTAMGWTSCPMVRGWNPGTTYQFAIYPRTTEGKTSVGPLTTQITTTAS